MSKLKNIYFYVANMCVDSDAADMAFRHHVKIENVVTVATVILSVY